jgi:hypothetical protein
MKKNLSQIVHKLSCVEQFRCAKHPASTAPAGPWRCRVAPARQLLHFAGAASPPRMAQPTPLTVTAVRPLLHAGAWRQTTKGMIQTAPISAECVPETLRG